MALKQKIQEFVHKIKTDINYQFGFIALLLVLGAVVVWLGVWYSINQKNNNNDIIVENENTNTVITNENTNSKLNLVPRKIDGVLVAENIANPYPRAVMIENLASEGVRPQYGLSKAQVVYEVIVESGITRFLAIYASSDEITQIGPVRSSRPTFLEYVSEYDALYSHAGGSPEAMQAISGLGIKDSSALGADSRFYWRDSYRQAPHNLFTSRELLSYSLRDKNYDNLIPEYQSWKFKDETVNDIQNIPEDKYIKIDFSSPGYAVEWKYNKAGNYYTRYNGGLEQKDALNDASLIAKNVIIQIVPPAISAGEDGRINFDVNGEGPVYIFIDGNKISGTWKKPSRTERTLFYNDKNEEISLNRGNTWIEILPADRTFENN